MKRFLHIVILLALYNICGFCLKFSMFLPAAVVGALFLVTAWAGAFVSLTRVILIILERDIHEF